MEAYLDAVLTVPLLRRRGRVSGIAGRSIEAVGPEVTIGEVCRVHLDTGAMLTAEAVGMKPGRVILMPYGELRGIGVGNEILATGRLAYVEVGDGLLGRVIDAFGAPLDGMPAPRLAASRNLTADPINPLTRPRIDQLLETGVRAIDTLLPLGRGQRGRCHVRGVAGAAAADG